MNIRTGTGFVLALAFLLAAVPGNAQTLQADASLLQAFHQKNTTGFSADVGESIAGRQFLGVEFTLFNPSFNYSFPILGTAHVAERVESAQVAYRFSFPLTFTSGNRQYAPVEIYVGAAGGLGRVRQTLTLSSNVGGASGTQFTAQETELCAELAAGLQFNFGPNIGVRAGFRYLDTINNVKLFNTNANTDTKALEAGVVFRF